jgi:hypothetical protein
MKHIMTIDLEYDFETKSTDSITTVLPKLLNLFDDHQINATFFVVGNLAEKFESELKSIPKRHEIASHSFSHPFMNTLSKEALAQELTKARTSLEALGFTPRGFRCPYFVLPKDKPYFFNLLKSNNFTYDSSLSSFFPGRYINLTKPTSPHKLHDIIELPMPNFIPKLLPAGLSYYKLLFPFSKLFIHRLPYMLYLHPCEFLNKPLGKEISFLIRQLYKINRGTKAWQIFKNLLDDSETEWITCQEYITKSLKHLNP